MPAGKVVSEWSFQKDGAEVPIKDIVNDNKAAQVCLSDRSCVYKSAFFTLLFLPCLLFRIS